MTHFAEYCQKKRLEKGLSLAAGRKDGRLHQHRQGHPAG